MCNELKAVDKAQPLNYHPFLFALFYQVKSMLQPLLPKCLIGSGLLDIDTPAGSIIGALLTTRQTLPALAIQISNTTVP